MVNKVILIGNLGADPELKYSQTGTPVARMRLATSERVKQGDDWVDHTEWHTVVAFGTTAENAGKYLTKGRQIYVEGKLRTRSWEAQDGSKRYTTEVIVDTLKYLGGGGAAAASAPAPAPEGDVLPPSSASAEGDDIPF